MSQVTTTGLDIAKHVFHAHGADSAGCTMFSRRLTRGKLLSFFVSQPRCTVALEACGGAHHWARELHAMGHEVRLIPPADVKPFVKRHKNDAVDAEAICEAAQRPTMRFVVVKSEEQQAAALVFRTRDLLVKQRTSARQCDPRAPDGIWLGRAQGAKPPRDAGRSVRRWRNGRNAARGGPADVRDNGRHAY